jgi:hypothetical protein
MKTTDSDYAVLTGVGTGLAIKGGTAVYNNRQAKSAARYNSFDELVNDYSKVKRGDIILFQGTFADEKIHPVMVIEDKGVESKFIELHPERQHGMISEGKVKDLLRYQSHDEKGFNPVKAARSISGAYRDPYHNASKLDNILNTVYANKHTYKYNPLKFEFNLAECGSGTCVTFVDALVRGSSDTIKPKTILPSDIVKRMDTVVKGRVNIKPSPSLLLTVPAAAGIKLMTDKNDTHKALGTGLAVGAGAGLLYKPVRTATNLSGGFASHAVGTQFAKDFKKLHLSDLETRTLGAAAIGSLATGGYLLAKKLNERN